jgi:hypothetical protein
LIVIAYLGNSKDKGNGKAPSNLVEPLDVPNFEASLGLVSPEDDSDFSEYDYNDYNPSDSDSEYEEDQGAALRNAHKSPYKRSSRVSPKNDHGHGEEELEAMMVDAAVTASLHDASHGDASTSAGSVGFHDSAHAAMAALAEEHWEQSLGTGAEVVSDGRLEDDLPVNDSEDEPIARKVKANPGKRRNVNKGKGKAENDSQGYQFGILLDRREARRQSRLEKQEMRMLQYRLGRRLTHVGF